MKIGNIADVKGGKRLPKDKSLISIPTLHPYIKIKDMYQNRELEITPGFEYVDNDTYEKIRKYTVNTGDVIIAIVGNTIGLVSLIGKSLDGANLTENCVKLINIKDYNNKYLYYYLKSPVGQVQIHNGIVGSSQPKLPIYNVEKIDIPEFSLDTQLKIVSVLDNIDEKININNKINQNLQEQAQAIYYHMIVENANASWTPGVLSDIAIITMGQSPKGESYNEEGIGTVFFQGRAEFGFRFPTRRLYTTDPKRMACANDALMSVRAPVGDMNVAYEDCCIGRGLGAIRSKDGHQSFVLYTMLALREQLNVFNGEGTVFGSINRDALKSMPVDIPPQDIIDQFEDIVAPMDATIRNNYDEICRLHAMRDNLLPRLMSGELDVSDIEL